MECYKHKVSVMQEIMEHERAMGAARKLIRQHEKQIAEAHAYLAARNLE